MADMSTEAAQGYDAPASAPCPFLATSDSFNAWHVGRFMKANGWEKPTPSAAMADQKRRAVASGRGDLVTLRGYKATLLASFRVSACGRVREAR